MADTSLIIGNGNWAVKEDSLLGYNIIQGKYVPIEMNVSRATTATRVNNAGLIELVPRNLLTYSEQFDNASWTQASTTVTANTVVAPNGTTTADTMTISDSNSRVLQTLALGAGTYKASVYVKVISQTTAGTLRFVGIVDGSNSTVNFTPTTEWQRVEGTFTAAIGITGFSIRGNASAFVGTIAIWGAQLETGNVATDYFPTTDRFDIPRVDYSTGTASLLVEPTRTNLVLYSEQFDNAIWTKSGVTIIANNTTAPDGNNTADLVTPTSLDSSLRQSFLAVGAMQYNFSVYLRSATGSSFSTAIRAWRDSPFQNIANSVITVTTEWQRFNFSFTALDSSTHIVAIGAGSTLSTGENFNAWGAQLEVGSNATSYIPTVASQLQRNADVITKTGISSLIGQTEGTLYAEFNNTLMTYVGNGYLIRIFADASNEVWIRKESGANTYSARWKANGTDVYTQLNIPVINGNNKIAIAYKSTNSAVYLNGNEIGTNGNTGTFSAAPSQIAIGSTSTADFFNDRIKSATLFQTRLSKPQCETLTSLI